MPQHVRRATFLIVYLVSLPVWNFVLPLYAFWHFDDFSWGETRKVANQKRKSKQDHGDAEGEFESGSIIMRKWEEWEKERLKAMGYRVQRRQSADRGINDLPPPAASTLDLNKNGSSSNLNPNNNNGTARSTGQVSGSLMASTVITTQSLGSTLNGSNISLRVGTPGATQQRPSANQSMSQQQQQQQPLIARGMGSIGRPRPSPHMMNRPPGSMGSQSRGIGSDVQSFEMGSMPTSSGPGPSRTPSRASFMATGTPNAGAPPGGAPGLDARHSVHQSSGYRPMGPRPMRPHHMSGVPPGGHPGSFPMSRPPPQSGFQGPAQNVGFRPRPGPGPGPGPGPSFHSSQPLFPNLPHQQQPTSPTEQVSHAGVAYPRPPMASLPISQSSMLPGDRHSHLIDHSGAAYGSSVAAPGGSHTARNEDGIVVVSDNFYVPSTNN